MEEECRRGEAETEASNKKGDKATAKKGKKDKGQADFTESEGEINKDR